MDAADNFVQNLPEMLAWDLAEREDVFLPRTITAGRPPAVLASETQTPDVPQRNPSRVARRLSYSAFQETILCSLKHNYRDRSPGNEDGYILKEAVPFYQPMRTRRQDDMLSVHDIGMKPGSEGHERGLYLNGLDEDWGSDSSADVEGGMSSPSVRTRQQSVATAATSIDFLIGHGGREATGCGEFDSFAGSPEKAAAQLGGTKAGSWVDLEPEALHLGFGDRGIELSRASQEWDQGCDTQAADFAREDWSERNQNPLRVPKRRSSLSHQVAAAVLGETAHSRKSSTHKSARELASQLLPPPPPQNSSHHLPLHHHLRDDCDESELAFGPSVPSRCPEPLHSPQTDPLQLRSDQLSLPPLSANEVTTHHDATLGHRQQKSSKPRKSHSVTNMPVLTRVNTWLVSSNGGAQSFPSDLVSPSSPSSMSPTRIRVATEVLENLRLIVSNFPDIALTTDCLTVQTIRSYARKLRRGDLVFERVSAHSSDEHASIIPESPTSPLPPSLSRKASLGSLNLMNSLRGKLGNRFGYSATSPILHEQGENRWPPSETRIPALRFGGPPSQGDSEIKSCVNALRTIFPGGTYYLLDLLYAHVVAYNYMNCLIGGLPHLSPNAPPHLRTQPSQQLPVGVTSLDDLRMHPDSTETVVDEFHQNVAVASSKVVVPAKAAAMLGLGSSHMGLPMKPVPGSRGGSRGGLKSKLRKISTPGPSLANQLESERALRNLRDDIALNVNRLVETIKTSSSAEDDQSQEEQDGMIMGPSGKELDPVLMRALCECVRCYEALYE